MYETDHTADGAVAAVGATPHATRLALLRKQARGYTLVRGVFVQLPEPDESGNRASVLAKFVHEGKHRALLLYLLLLGAAPTLASLDEPVQADVWVRALTASANKEALEKGASRPLTWTRSTLSRAWGDLVAMGLVSRRRIGRLTDVVPCREDGKGQPYEPPGGRKDLWNAYFVLPDVFWAEGGLFSQLTLPGLAMLLLFAKETNRTGEVYFTFDQIEDWYGIKRRTAQNGVKQLAELGVLSQRREMIAAPLSPTGSTVRTWYSLTGEFGHLARQAMRETAKTERAARLTRTSQSPEMGTPGVPRATKAAVTEVLDRTARKEGR